LNRPRVLERIQIICDGVLLRSLANDDVALLARWLQEADTTISRGIAQRLEGQLPSYEPAEIRLERDELLNVVLPLLASKTVAGYAGLRELRRNLQQIADDS